SLSQEDQVDQVLRLPIFHDIYLVVADPDRRGHGPDHDDHRDHDHALGPNLLIALLDTGTYHRTQQNEDGVDHLGLSVDNLHTRISNKLRFWNHTIVFGRIFSITISLSITWC